MPRGDGSGPVGTGPQTGRDAGFCNANRMAGFVSAGRGCFGGGRGRGMRMGNEVPGRLMGSFVPMKEQTFLKQQETVLYGTLEEVRKRIEALENSEK